MAKKKCHHVYKVQLPKATHCECELCLAVIPLLEAAAYNEGYMAGLDRAIERMSKDDSPRLDTEDTRPISTDGNRQG